MKWITLVETDWERCKWMQLDGFASCREAWDGKIELESLGYRAMVLWSPQPLNRLERRKGESNEDQG